VKRPAKSLVVGHITLVLALLAPVAQAATTPPAQAKAGKLCSFKNSEALSLQGALVCDGKKWNLIKSSQETIQSKAFRSVLSRWSKQPNVQLSLDIYADPETGNWTQQIETGIRAGARFWGTSDSSSKPMPVIISDNYLYIEKILTQLNITQNPEDKERNAKAEGGQAGFHGAWDDPNAYWDFLFTNTDSRNNSGFWQVPAHEYTHFAQSKLSNRNWSNQGGLRWMDEGIPSYIGAALGPMSKMPNDIMNAWKEDLASTTVKLEYFSTEDRGVYSRPTWSDVYPLGAVASEALVALVGVDALIQYYSDTAGGISLPNSFKKNFGITNTQMTGILSRYLDSVKTGKAWKLKALEAEYKKATLLNQ
jgi:hypothetical protein